MESANSRVVRFGVFEVDLAARELRKRGVRLKLQDQPFRVLEALLSKPGEIVTREELKDRLWAQDEFVEFDKSLNTAVQKIREALDDSAKSPRFLETVPKVGYKFVAAVQAAGGDPAPPPPPRPVWPMVAALALVGAGVYWWINGPTAPTFDPSAYRLRQLTRDDGLTFQPALSRDGKLIVYASDRDGQGNLDLYVQQVSGGSPTRITDHPADDYQPHFSPDGSQIAFRSDRSGGGIHIKKPFGDEPPRLIASQGRAPRFSPDGAKIVFQRGFRPVGTTIHVVDLKSSEETRIAPNLRITFGPIWSADAQAILFWGGRAGLREIDWWAAGADGGDAEHMGAYERLRGLGIQSPVSAHVVNGPVNLLPGGREILFAARSGDDSRLWRIPLAGSGRKVSGNPEPVTLGASKPVEPSVAENGTIAFEQFEDRFDIVGIPVGGSAEDMRTIVRDVAYQSKVSISVDGGKVAYTAVRDGQADVYVYDLRSGATLALTDTPEQERSALISRDGRHVIYHSRNTIGKPFSVSLIASDGGPTRQICESCQRISDWSVNSNRLLQEGRRLIEMDVETAREAKVLYERETPTWDPHYSPDDQWIAFMRYTEGAQGRQLFIAEIGDTLAEERDWIAISQGHLIEGFAAWATDGGAIYYWSSGDPEAEDEGFALWRQGLDGQAKTPLGVPERIIHLPEYRRWPVSQGLAAPWLAVSENLIIFKLADLRGNIWIMEPTIGE